MKECICFPSKKEPHDKCCTCIQDDSHSWYMCDVHGQAKKDAMIENLANRTTCPTCEGKGYLLPKTGQTRTQTWDGNRWVILADNKNINFDPKKAYRHNEEKCGKSNFPHCCNTHWQEYINTPG